MAGPKKWSSTFYFKYFPFGSLVTICIWQFTPPPLESNISNWQFLDISHLVVWPQFALVIYPPPPRIGHLWLVCLAIFHLVVWSQFAFGSLPPYHPPHPLNQTFLVGSFGYFHLVVWSQFVFGNLPLPPPPPPELVICGWYVWLFSIWQFGHNLHLVVYPPPPLPQTTTIWSKFSGHQIR